MEITVKLNNILVFKKWQNSKAEKNWQYRALKSINGVDTCSETSGIVLCLVGEQDIDLYWFGEELSPIKQIYQKLYPNVLKCRQIDEAKNHTDNFLNKIDSLKVFL